MAPARTRPGRPYPFGATWDGRGVNFALQAGPATAVDLCLFDVEGQQAQRLPMAHRQHGIWYVYVPDLAPGARYGWRVSGPCDPASGARCNPNKVLLDPYARSVVGEPDWDSSQYGYVVGEDTEDLSCSLEDDAGKTLLAEVVDNRFDWGDSTPPRTPWRRTVFYEIHVKGYTQAHPDVPEAVRGTYAGLASPAAIAHLKSLGVTAVELLPVHAFVDDHRLVDLGLRNYWGYNSIGFFAPEARYSADRSPGGPVREFKRMVKALHEAGIEVILDVVYNHTAEGNHLGPTLSFKGIDNAAYYRLSAEDRRFCVDYTGTGNTLDTTHPAVIRLIMDSLRYWVTEMQVDGFRFDLATTLGRGAVHFDPRGPFFAAIAQDPVLADVKLIAEPWDLGPDGYRVGAFPHGWAEWNGVYRDTVRSFWCQREGHLTQLAMRLCGSADLYEHAGRAPTDSVNLVTVHDGFTLHDLVSYHHKRNTANGEDNRDGESHNRGWNCGAEGPTDDELVLAQRERLKRNLLATLLLSQGTPLLLGGDEMGRTQHGNNNGYCQDNEISWIDWTPTPAGQRLLAFTTRLLSLRRELPALSRGRFFDGRPGPDGVKDLTWLLPDGHESGAERWHDPTLTAVAALMAASGPWDGVDDEDAVGLADPGSAPGGWGAAEVLAAAAGLDIDADASATATAAPTPVPAAWVLLLVNSADEPVVFHLPAWERGSWIARIDTCTRSGFPVADGEAAPRQVTVAGRSLQLLSQERAAVTSIGTGDPDASQP